MSQFTIDVLELAVKQGRAVTNSTMFSLAIAESSLNRKGLGKKSYDAAVLFAASIQPHLLDEWVRACYSNEKPLNGSVFEVSHMIEPESTETKAEAVALKEALQIGGGAVEDLQAQLAILEHLVAETYEILEKEKA